MLASVHRNIYWNLWHVNTKRLHGIRAMLKRFDTREKKNKMKVEIKRAADDEQLGISFKANKNLFVNRWAMCLLLLYVRHQRFGASPNGSDYIWIKAQFFFVPSGIWNLLPGLIISTVSYVTIRSRVDFNTIDKRLSPTRDNTSNSMDKTKRSKKPNQMLAKPIDVPAKLYTNNNRNKETGANVASLVVMVTVRVCLCVHPSVFSHGAWAACTCTHTCLFAAKHHI